MNCRFQSRGDKAGFSLVEVVIVLFLTGLVLAAVSGLISRTLESLKFMQEKGRTLESATLGCERLSSELREAVAIDSPSPAGQVIFYKIKPSAPEAAGNDLSSNVEPQNWRRNYQPDANGVNQRFKVSYLVDSERRLQRTADTMTTLVATEVNSFVVSPLAAAGCFRVSLSIQEKRRIIVFETIVTCPALQVNFTP